MIERLIELDHKLFLLLNGAGTGWLDPFMLFLSSTWMWVPVYLFVAIFLVKKKGWKGLAGLAVVFLTLLATDQASVHLFKEVFERLRPCHDPALEGRIRLVAGNCGGQFGFVSSHAANSFGLAVISAGLVKKKLYTLLVIIWALIVSYSRIYLGVHFPGDMIGGILLGLLIGWIILKLHDLIIKKIQENAKPKET